MRKNAHTYTGKRVAIDTMLMIYVLEHHSEYMQVVAEIFEDAKSVICSPFLFGELFAGLYKRGDQKTVDTILGYVEDAEHMEVYPFDYATSLIFAKIRGQHPNYSSPDCIHLATALQNEADVFITNDKKLKDISGLKVLCLEELV